MVVEGSVVGVVVGSLDVVGVVGVVVGASVDGVVVGAVVEGVVGVGVVVVGSASAPGATVKTVAAETNTAVAMRRAALRCGYSISK
ncbi:hypothetical protein DFR70_109226 [Nocardia tenerifensis]|uniref:Uncharacterized protein n=1 Tax=Nocardia tenerifensis TaxID=228006 RepID=A0A318K1J4_9NOCA|nr:hypothetical protein [Nocardia tenerifensis]PXX61035.1 hypothetical protein DFR70_109226 [Nocardia tenerifensis]